ncbi:hypothetical protein [Bifidobacterium aquikefiri]|uniref:hypothetical protein n=1 Tax=Bifidobacterium aquikefiri TaxID=1653207 RepID=UPI0023F07CB7|nr:hypothetical protein [Bifidobacterium aquikefiri]
MKGTRSWHDEVLGNGYSLLYLLQRRQDRQSDLVIARPLCSLITAVLFTLTVWVWYTWLGVLVVFGLSSPVFLSSIAVFSYAGLPGMDVHGNHSALQSPITTRRNDHDEFDSTVGAHY